jgi:hypothetical protein
VGGSSVSAAAGPQAGGGSASIGRDTGSDPKARAKFHWDLNISIWRWNNSGRPEGFGLDVRRRSGETMGLSPLRTNDCAFGRDRDFAVGEYPIPTASLARLIEYNASASAAYTPTVFSNGRISIRVRPEVSELSAQA